MSEAENTPDLIAIIAGIASGDNPPSPEVLALLYEFSAKERENRQRVQFNEALAKAQKEFSAPRKTAKNPITRSPYAPLEEVHKATKPVLALHGLSTSFGTTKNREHEGTVVVWGRLSHIGGHSELYEMEIALDKGGIKGGANKTDIQALGSSLTYARRYLLCLMLDIAPDDDDDGNSGTRQQEAITSEQAQNLHRELEGAGIDKEAFLTWLGATSIETLPRSDYAKAMGGIQRKRKQQG